MRVAPHHHPCQRCGRKTECPGTWEENYDGWPDVICDEWHLPSGDTNPEFLCDECAELPDPDADDDDPDDDEDEDDDTDEDEHDNDDAGRVASPAGE